MHTDYLYNRIFYYVSTLAGSGKTYQLVREAFRLASNGEKVVIVNPSIKLNDQDEKELKLLNPDFPIKRIDTGPGNNNGKDTISEQITDYIKKINPDKGCILIITHQSFWNIKYWHNQSDWTILWDEVYDISTHLDYPIKPPNKERFIFPYIDFNKEEEFSLLKTNLEERPIEPDIVDKAFEPIYQEFINSHNGLCDIWYHSVFHNTNKFIITSLYRPDIFKGFKKAEFFGAMIENSLMFQHFKKKGIRWEVEKSIMNKLGFTKHNKELRVYYAYPEGNHTKHFLNKKVDGMTLLEHFQLKALDFLGNQVFLLMDNKSSEKKLLNSIAVPFNLQGLNEYQEVHNLLYLGTFNKEPTFYKFINKFLKYEMDESSYHLYQSLMRTSYRNPDDYTPVNIFIPCLSLFEPLKSYFINVDYVSLDLDHLDYYKRQDVYLTEEVYENKKSVLVELFGTKFWKEQDRIRDEFIINGYELATVMVMDKWKNVQTKELWYLAVFPDSLLDYCHKKKWKFMRTLDSNNFEQLPVVKNE